MVEASDLMPTGSIASLPSRSFVVSWSQKEAKEKKNDWEELIQCGDGYGVVAVVVRKREWLASVDTYSSQNR